MSAEGDSPHGVSISENDPNSSIIYKVKSRVSSIFPNSFSKWFSSSQQNDSKNGSLRRRRESASSSVEENDIDKDENDQDDDDALIGPSSKKTRYSINEKTSTPLLEKSNSPGTSGLLNRSITSTNRVEKRFSSSTPTSVIDSRNRRYLGLKKTVTSTPYDFQSVNPRLTMNIDLTNNNNDDDVEEVQINEHIVDNGEDAVVRSTLNKRSPTSDVHGRRNIHENCIETTRNQTNSEISKRRRLVIEPRVKQTRQNLNVPIDNYVGVEGDRHLRNTAHHHTPYRIHTPPPKVRSSFVERSLNETVDDEEDEVNDEPGGQDTVDEITIQVEDRRRDDVQNVNGLNTTPTESEVSISSYIDRPSSSASKRNHDDDGGSGSLRHQYSSGLFSSRPDKNMHSSNIAGINFASHLQTEKSLFSDKNLSSGLTNSTMSLNSWNRRPSFNPSLYGSTSALSDSRLMNLKSPFYDGKTMYGGSSAYTKNLNRMNQKALRVPVQIRPSSSLSTTSSNNSSALTEKDSKNPAISNTAKRILELMNQMTGPLNDAKKMGNISRITPSPSQRQRFSEDELQLNRSIRLNVPYTRPNDSSIKKIPPINRSFMAELEIPTVAQLIQMKRLQNSTERVRELANASKSVLNTNKIDYQLPTASSDGGDHNDENNSSRRHITKMKNKIASVRKDKQSDLLEETAPEVNLPTISFPHMKAMPKIDIAINNSNADTKTLTSSVGVASKMLTSQSSSKLSSSQLGPIQQTKPTFGFSSTTSSSTSSKTLTNDSSFVFSSPIQIESTASTTISSLSAEGNFKFSKPIQVDSEDNPPKSSVQFNFTPCGGASASTTSLKTNNSTTQSLNEMYKVPTLKQGSVLDALKSFSQSTPSKTIDLTNDDDTKSTKTSNLPPLSAIVKPNSGATWECDTCMVMNKSDAVKCIACETPKAGSTVSSTPATGNTLTGGITLPKPTNSFTFGSIPAAVSSSTTTSTSTGTFGDKFKPSPDTWECDVCMVRNNSDKLACVSCSSLKPGGGGSVGADKPKPSFSFGVPTPLAASSSVLPSKPVDESFKKLVATQNEKWECSTCMTRNDSNKKKCVCCEQAKPGEVSSDAPKFTFGMKPGGGFTFGMPAASSTSTTSVSIVATTTASSSTGFIFGANPTTVSSTSTTSSAVKPSFSFGAQPTVSVSDTKESNKSTTVTSTPSTGLVFGAAQPIKSTTVATDVATNQNLFSFGQPAKAATSTPAPTIIASTSSSTSTAATTTQSIVSTTETKPTISFGSPSEGIKFGGLKSATASEPQKPDENKSRLGGFSFGSPAATPATATTTSSITFGTTSSSPAQFGSLSKPTPTFGSSTTTTTALTFGATTTTPSFGSSSLTTATSTAATAVKPIIPTFGNLSSVTSMASTTPTFGASVTSNESSAKPPAFGSSSTFGSSPFGGSPTSKPLTKEEPKTFGSFSSASTKPADNPFASPSTNSSKPPAFSTTPFSFSSTGGSAASSGVATSTSTPFAFGGSSGVGTQAPSSNVAPPSFGPGLNQTTPSFGQANSTNTTATPSAVFGPFGNASNPNSANPSPVFGATGGVQSPFEQTNNNTPKFGSSAASTSLFGSGGTTGQTMATSTPAFGSSSLFGGNAMATSGQQANTFGGGGASVAPPAFGSNMFGGNNADTVDTNEPNAKKSTMFAFGSTNNQQQQQQSSPFMFGASTNNNNNNNNNATQAKVPFNFELNSTPSFNFGSPPQQGSQQPFAFGQTAAAPTTAFKFGATNETTPNQTNPFGGNNDNSQNNPFAAGPVSTRRKVKATRKFPPR